MHTTRSALASLVLVVLALAASASGCALGVGEDVDLDLSDGAALGTRGDGFYLGCYASYSPHVLPDRVPGDDYTPETCAAAARAAGQPYAALEAGGECWIGPSPANNRVRTESCSARCRADADEWCGGTSRGNPDHDGWVSEYRLASLYIANPLSGGMCTADGDVFLECASSECAGRCQPYEGSAVVGRDAATFTCDPSIRGKQAAFVEVNRLCNRLFGEDCCCIQYVRGRVLVDCNGWWAVGYPRRASSPPPPPACTPTSTCESANAVCGMHYDGCAWVDCGSCGEGETCSADQSMCEPPVCVPATSCAAEGRSCGAIDDGCEWVDCGSCGAGERCTDGACVADAPPPSIAAVVNAVTYGNDIGPGDALGIWGERFAESGNQVTLSASSRSLTLGAGSPWFYESVGQINVQLPSDWPHELTRVSVQRPDGARSGERGIAVR
ncbi:MAG: WSC domain-containing protein [Sandaracinaceae bacterium]